MELSPGQIIGDYKILSRLSAGGMGVVYLGQPLGKPQDLVAIKTILFDETEEWEAMRSFVDEAMVSVRMSHDNLVRVDELGEDKGVYYLVMEYIHGTPLATIMRAMGRQGRRMAPELAVWISKQVALGLHSAHNTIGYDNQSLEIVHRDVSPQNILVSSAGDIKLTDFGIAKSMGRASRTKQGVIKGKFRYLAPEQAFGKRLDHRVDVYALGIVLWEMLTMRRMWGKLQPLELLQRIREGDFEPPSRFAPELPRSVENVVMRAISYDRSERYASAEEFAGALDLALDTSHVGKHNASALLHSFAPTEIQERSRLLPQGYFENQPIVDQDDLDEVTVAWTRSSSPISYQVSLDEIDEAELDAAIDSEPYGIPLSETPGAKTIESPLRPIKKDSARSKQGEPLPGESIIPSWSGEQRIPDEFSESIPIHKTEQGESTNLIAAMLVMFLSVMAGLFISWLMTR